MITEEFLALLQCPTCGVALRVDSPSNLRCESGHHFQLIDGVPILIDFAAASAEEREQYEHQRDVYDHAYGQQPGYRIDLWQKAYLRRLEPLWHSDGSSPFLDVGAGGDAYTVIEAARTGVRAVGCDISIDAMRLAAQRAAAQGLAERCLFVVSTAERLPFRSAAFGAVAAIHVLEHLPDDGAAFAELARILRARGQVYVGTPNAIDHMPLLLRPLYRRHDRAIGHIRQYTAESLSSMAIAAGLRPERIFYSGHWVKVWQLVIHLLAGRLHIDDSALWWRFEAADERAAARDGALHLNLVAVRP